MDLIKIASDWMKETIAEVLIKQMVRKLGYDVKLELNDFLFETNDGKINIHLNIDGELTKEEFRRILKESGLL